MIQIAMVTDCDDTSSSDGDSNIDSHRVTVKVIEQVIVRRNTINA